MADEALRRRNVALVRSFIEAINDDWDVAAMAALVSDDFLFTIPFAPEWFPVRHEGKAAALAGAPAIQTALPAGNSLASQLRIVAQLISVSQELGAKRQVFFVSLGGFDNHDSILTDHPTLMTRLGAAMRYFHDVCAELGVLDRVTAFTGSDFGRTLTSNANGSDHGWVSMHFVMGGAVRGRAIYGTPPAIANNGPDDVGQGRLLPSLSVDQYASTLASWFGVSSGNLSTVVPNISNYNPSTWNIGFV